MSRELLWELSRDSSCFVVRRNGHEFSREALNTMNKNSFKHSAVANCNVRGTLCSSQPFTFAPFSGRLLA